MLHVRCGPIDPVSEDSPNGRSIPAAELIPRRSPCTCSSDARGRRIAARIRPDLLGGVDRLAGQRAQDELRAVGSGAGCQMCSDGWGGLSSNITVIRSVAETPSTIEWWTLDSSAQRFLLSTLDHPDLPQWPPAIQVLGEDPGGGAA